MNDKLLGYINIAKKANYLVVGSDILKDYRKKLFLILYDKEAQNSVKKIVYDFKQKDIEVVEVEKLEDIVNIENCKIVGVKNKGLSEVILKNLNRGENN